MPRRLAAATSTAPGGRDRRLVGNERGQRGMPHPTRVWSDLQVESPAPAQPLGYARLCRRGQTPLLQCLQIVSSLGHSLLGLP